MKKSVYLLVLALGFATNVNSKGYHVLISVNRTTGDSISQNFNYSPCNLNVSATAGDSLTLYIYYADFGTFTLETPQQWYLEGDSIQGSHLVDPLNIIAPATGNITAGFAGSMYMQFTIVSTTGIFEHNQSSGSLSMFPGMAHNYLNLEVSVEKQGDVTVNFYDENGRLVKETLYKTLAGKFIKTENIEALPSGIYIVKVTTPAKLLTGKFIKL